MPEDFDRIALSIRSPKSGYVQTLDCKSLTRFAATHDLLLQVKVKPGDFVSRGSCIVALWSGKQVHDQVSDAICRAFLIGFRPRIVQDIGLAIDQLVEIAVRALSPGINNPFTAMSCIDWLGDALFQFNGRALPPSYHYDDQHRLRVITPLLTFDSLTEKAFSQIRQATSANSPVALHLLKTLAWLITGVDSQEMREALLHQASLIEQGSRQDLPGSVDQQKVGQLYQQILAMHREGNGSI